MAYSGDNRDHRLVANAENFTLKDFVPLEGTTLDERVAPCWAWLDDPQHDIGDNARIRTFYGREIAGPIAAVTPVRDPISGEHKDMLMFGSNDYLGLASHPEVVGAVRDAATRYGAAMAGSSLLNGRSSLHLELERCIARFKGRDDAILFTTGYQAQLGWVNALLRAGDTLLYDELHHASMYDAAMLVSAWSRTRSRRFMHSDCSDLRRSLEFANGSRREGAMLAVAIESVYSMDGDIAPLPDVRQLCDEHGAVLCVDEAHATGVLGATGRGAEEHFGLHGSCDLLFGTLSKSLGGLGGYVTGSAQVVDYMRFYSRSYMFTTSLPPTVVAGGLAALSLLGREPERVAMLRCNSAYLVSELQRAGFSAASETAIIPIRIPPEVNMRTLAWRCHQEGVFLNPIEYPAVPRDAHRLRISVMATHTREHLDALVSTLRRIADELGFAVRGRSSAGNGNPQMARPTLGRSVD